MDSLTKAQNEESLLSEMDFIKTIIIWIKTGFYKNNY